MLELLANDTVFIISGLGITWGLAISLLAYRHLHESAEAVPHLFSSFKNLRNRFGQRGARLAWWGGLLVYFGILVNAAKLLWTP